jgi:tetraacyldisaccharide 4'-kinase
MAQNRYVNAGIMNKEELFYHLVLTAPPTTGIVLLRMVLALFAAGYGLGVCAARTLRTGRARDARCRVISVGNITLGGTGKTPFVGYIARFLLAHGHKVAVVSRGYKRCTGGASCLRDGDEPQLLRGQLPNVPVIVDSDRLRGCRKAVDDHGADTVLLDDGFQQWGIKKDLDIVMVDTVRGLGNGWILPRGILREAQEELRRADILAILHIPGTDMQGLEERLRGLCRKDCVICSVHYEPQSFVVCARPQQSEHCAGYRGKKAVIMSGIGNPLSFEALVRSTGIAIAAHLRFPDHHPYSAHDITQVISECRRLGAEVVVTTEKDAVRLACVPEIRLPLPVCALRVDLKVGANEQELHHRLLRIYPA